ncbi:MAG: 50S ribosomal protein L23 [Candidatus Aenigmatarchaeota archaeon]|nr:MAG: 50S ribosomal protein L23 [Candidatus Aenigmarchaeota archaeon]
MSEEKTVKTATKAVKKAAPKKDAKVKPKAGARTDAVPTVDPWTILQYPHLTEKSLGMVDSRNTLVFVVDPRVTKRQVRWAVERAFGVRVVSVNTLNDMMNRKRAFVKLAKENSALDIATRLGMV